MNDAVQSLQPVALDPSNANSPRISQRRKVAARRRDPVLREKITWWLEKAEGCQPSSNPSTTTQQPTPVARSSPETLPTTPDQLKPKRQRKRGRRPRKTAASSVLSPAHPKDTPSASSDAYNPILSYLSVPEPGPACSKPHKKHFPLLRSFLSRLLLPRRPWSFLSRLFLLPVLQNQLKIHQKSRRFLLFLFKQRRQHHKRKLSRLPHCLSKGQPLTGNGLAILQRSRIDSASLCN